jgi:hypothetical protein
MRDGTLLPPLSREPKGTAMKTIGRLPAQKGQDGIGVPDRRAGGHDIGRMIGFRTHVKETARPGGERATPAPLACQRAFNLVIVALATTLLCVAGPAYASHTVSCRADPPVHPGEPMSWRALVSGGSGALSFSWTGDEGLTGSGPVAT